MPRKRQALSSAPLSPVCEFRQIQHTRSCKAEDLPKSVPIRLSFSHSTFSPQPCKSTSYIGPHRPSPPPVPTNTRLARLSSYREIVLFEKTDFSGSYWCYSLFRSCTQIHWVWRSYRSSNPKTLSSCKRLVKTQGDRKEGKIVIALLWGKPARSLSCEWVQVFHDFSVWANGNFKAEFQPPVYVRLQLFGPWHVAGIPHVSRTNHHYLDGCCVNVPRTFGIGLQK